MNRPTFDDIKERLDILEAAWEKLIDKSDGQEEVLLLIEEALLLMREKQNDDKLALQENIFTLRNDILALKGERLPGVDEMEQEMLDEIPEFDSVDEIEAYAKEELAKGNRAATIQRWIDDPDNYKGDDSE